MVQLKEVGQTKKSSNTFFRVFGTLFGHFLVTYSYASVNFFRHFWPNSFYQTPFAAG